MNKPIKSGRYLMVAAVSALLPLTAVQADDRDYRSYDQGTSGAQGPMRSDTDSSTPTYSGEDRRQFQDETPGAQGPVRSDSTLHEDSTSMQSQQQDPYDRSMRGAEGPTRSDMEAEKQGFVGDPMTGEAWARCSINDISAPNAYYGEQSAISSPQGRATLFGRGRWC